MHQAFRLDFGELSGVEPAGTVPAKLDYIADYLNPSSL
jgi:hypothetical protein